MGALLPAAGVAHAAKELTVIPATKLMSRKLPRPEERLFVNRKRELGIFRDWMVSPGLLNVWGPPGIGKSSLLRAFQRSATKLGRRTVLVDGRDLNREPKSFLARLGADSIEELKVALADEPTVIFIDTLWAAASLTQYLREEFFPAVADHTGLVVAGRQPLRQSRPRVGTTLKVAEIELKPLSEEDSLDYLRQRGVLEERTSQQILETCCGLPLALSLAADLATNLGVRAFRKGGEWQLTLHALAEELLGEAQDPELREALEVCSIIGRFDETTLAAMLDGRDSAQIFARLTTLSVVEPAEHGLRLHEEARRILQKDLRWRNPARHDSIRNRALVHLGERTLHASPAERELLVLDRLALWEHEFVQSIMFQDPNAADIWVAPGGKDEHCEIMDLWTRFGAASTGVRPSDEAAAVGLELLGRILDLPDRILAVAHDASGILGFTVVLPVTTSSAELIYGGSALDRLLSWYRAETCLPRWPTSAHSSRIYCVPYLACSDRAAGPTQAALLREIVRIFARGGTYLVATAIPAYKLLLNSLRFERIPQITSTLWSREAPTEGFILRLDDIGFENWIESTIAGSTGAARVGVAEIENLLREVLIHWRNDRIVERSALASLLQRALGGEAGPEAVRKYISECLEKSIGQAVEPTRTALQAVELVYLRGCTHETAAERLMVSRATHFRRVRQGTAALAAALDLRKPIDDYAVSPDSVD